MIIDFHTHNFPDALAKRAVEVMCGKLAACGHQALVPVGDGTVATQLRDMDRAGIDFCVNCPVATYPGNFDAITRRAVAVRSGAAGEAAAKRIVQLGSINPADPDFAVHVAELKRLGIPGIKLHPNYQGIRLDDPQWVPFFTALRDAGLFVISHCGFDPGYVEENSVAGPNEIAVLLRTVPGLKFVAAHLGGECGNPPHATDQLLEFPNCWIDTAAQYFRPSAEETRRIMREWPADRMVFGSDYFWCEQTKFIDWVKELRPKPAEQELVFHANAERLLGLNGNGI